MTNGESIVRKPPLGREFATGIKERLLPTICVFFERKESRSCSSLQGRPFFCFFSEKGKKMVNEAALVRRSLGEGGRLHFTLLRCKSSSLKSQQLFFTSSPNHVPPCLLSRSLTVACEDVPLRGTCEVFSLREQGLCCRIHCAAPPLKSCAALRRTDFRSVRASPRHTGAAILRSP